MSDHTSQLHVPPSFAALYTDARHRLTLGRDELWVRYEVCEDLAQQLVDHGQQIHFDHGIAEDEVLARCLAGLEGAESGLSGAEAVWVVTRLAELLGWPWVAAVGDAAASPG
ncbi:MAG: hypothetical protein RL375_2226 [Pseudomonadota bacterium]|jgi:hypothetical protein